MTQIKYHLPNHSFSYAVYYHPTYNLLGLDTGYGAIRVYLDKDTRTYIPKTDAWVRIGEL